MYQSEALWINIPGDYPCAIKVAAGKINAVSGRAWEDRLSDNLRDYAVVPGQPWLDGFNVAKGYIRQFVAMPLGEGFTAEEQITGQADHGGLQISVYPMRHDVYMARYARRVSGDDSAGDIRFSRAARVEEPDMGLPPGGLMRQEICEGDYGIDAWDPEHGYRCFVHLANSTVYQEITGHLPPHKPPTERQYTQAGLPWFEYYSDGKALKGASSLGGLMGVAAKTIGMGNSPLPDNDPVTPRSVRPIGKEKVGRDEETEPTSMRSFVTADRLDTLNGEVTR